MIVEPFEEGKIPMVITAVRVGENGAHAAPQTENRNSRISEDQRRLK
jgi:hypothetical protein